MLFQMLQQFKMATFREMQPMTHVTTLRGTERPLSGLPQLFSLWYCFSACAGCLISNIT